MASTGYKFPSGATTAALGAIDWTNADNVKADDGSYATAEINSGIATYYLIAYGFDFSAIPAAATIDGVLATVECHSTNAASVTDYYVKLLSAAGAPTGTNMDLGVYLGSSDSLHDYGGATVKWGCALTSSWVKSEDFGVAVSFQSEQDGEVVYVDYVIISVYYTVPGGGAQVITARPFYGPLTVRCS